MKKMSRHKYQILQLALAVLIVILFNNYFGAYSILVLSTIALILANIFAFQKDKYKCNIFWTLTPYIYLSANLIEVAIHSNNIRSNDVAYTYWSLIAWGVGNISFFLMYREVQRQTDELLHRIKNLMNVIKELKAENANLKKQLNERK